LQGQQAIGRGVAPQQRQERIGPDQDGLGLAVDGQDVPGGRIFQGVQHFGQVAVEFSAADETHRGLGHDHPLGRAGPAER
jgi:hypothetical protein